MLGVIKTVHTLGAFDVLLNVKVPEEELAGIDATSLPFHDILIAIDPEVTIYGILIVPITRPKSTSYKTVVSCSLKEDLVPHGTLSNCKGLSVRLVPNTYSFM